MILLPAWYMERHYLSRRFKTSGWRRLVWWIPALLLAAATLYFTFSVTHFLPENMAPLRIFLWCIGLYAVPKCVFALCSSVGWAVCKVRGRRMNWGNLLGIVLALTAFGLYLYGSTRGVSRLRIHHEDIYVENLPEAFEGYRIVHVSDIHLGTFEDGRMHLLARDIDSINAVGADMIAFTGDIVNQLPEEFYPATRLLRSLKAKDGVFAVLGNHDYSDYTHLDDFSEAANQKEIVSRERQMGWKLLLNENRKVERGKAAIYVAGEESGCMKEISDGKVNLQHALAGIPEGAFVILLEHTPHLWRVDVLPNSEVQLMLSGHTHGGQIRLMGLRASMFQGEDHGLYEEDGRYLHVSAGLGGVMPLRIGVPPEFTVITLHRRKQA